MTGEGRAQIPNQRWKIFDMTMKEKVRKWMKASVKALADIVTPKEKKWWGYCLYIHMFKTDCARLLERNLY
jgi:hypothetical protein